MSILNSHPHVVISITIDQMHTKKVMTAHRIRSSETTANRSTADLMIRNKMETEYDGIDLEVPLSGLWLMTMA